MHLVVWLWGVLCWGLVCGGGVVASSVTAGGVGYREVGVIYDAEGMGEWASSVRLEPKDVVEILKRQGIVNLRLYDAEWAMLEALRSSGIEVIVGLRNQEVVQVGMSLDSARSWVDKNILHFFPDTKISAIAVGSEALSSSHGDDRLVPLLVPAMRNIHAALVALGLENHIKVSSPQSALLFSSYEPGALTFHPALANAVLLPLLDFLASTGSYFMLNVYSPPDSSPVENEALVHSFNGDESLQDSGTWSHYAKMFNSLVDAARVAIASLHHQGLDIVVTETGWSGTSDSDAEKLINHISAELGNPLNPGGAVQAYFHIASLRNTGGRSASILRQLMEVKDKLIEDSTGVALGTKIAEHRKLADRVWCVAKDNVRADLLQVALDWACGSGGADCSLLQSGQSCFIPNTVVAHASYAFNSYYQTQITGSCDFNGLAYLTSNDPSTPGCSYPSTRSGTGSGSAGTGGSFVGRHNSNPRQFVCTLLIVTVFLIGNLYWGF